MKQATTTAAALLRVVVTGTIVVGAGALLAGCGSTTRTTMLSGAEPLERVVGPKDKVTPGGGRYQVGKPYNIGGRTYVPHEDPNLDQSGLASWYGGDYHHGTKTANGEVYDRTSISAAHKTMPLPSYARVTNLNNGRSIVVRVNDRGPYVGSRIIDLSEKTAELLDMKRYGLGKVRVQYVARAGLGGSDSRVLAATLSGPGINSGHDERTLLAQADLRGGPRRDLPASAPTLVASATRAAPTGAAQASLYGQARAASTTGLRSVAFVQTDATSFELAGVDAAKMRAALLAARPAAAPATLSTASVAPASGAPMSILPSGASTGAVAASDDEDGAGVTRRTSSYAATDRIDAAHAIFRSMGAGDRLAALAD